MERPPNKRFHEQRIQKFSIELVDPLGLGGLCLRIADRGLDGAHHGGVEERSGRGAAHFVAMTDSNTLFALQAPAAALAAGLVASLHCVGMCGPLSCSLLTGARERKTWWPHGFYHLGRLLSYASLGALAGGIGAGVVNGLGHRTAPFAPWAFALFFLLLALGWDGFLTRWQARIGVGRNLTRRAYRLTGGARGFALGALTPLIPCGPLYLALWAVTMSGSWLAGSVAMAAYAAGTIPALFAAQSGWGWLSARARPETLQRLRRGLAFAAVGVICARAFVDTDLNALLAGEALCH